MELLGKVYDGSEQEVGDGYHLCKIVAADIESTRIIPLYCEAYSYESEEVRSENSELLKAVDLVRRYTGDKGIHAIDRGGDRGVIYKYYLKRDIPQRFVVRLKERDLESFKLIGGSGLVNPTGITAGVAQALIATTTLWVIITCTFISE